MRTLQVRGALVCIGFFLFAGSACAAKHDPPRSPLLLPGCDSKLQVPACSAVRGDRAEGWLAQSRSPVLARNGIVVTSQPLAAQAGIRILMEGGNAVDAAVATAAALNVTEPMNVGMGGDLFAIVYIAKERKVHVLNASGTAPAGATVARFKALGYTYDPTDWGPGSGMPPGEFST